MVVVVNHTFELNDEDAVQMRRADLMEISSHILGHEFLVEIRP